MKHRLLDHIVCPLDGTALELVDWESRRLAVDDSARAKAEALGVPVERLTHDVVTGLLLNRQRRIAYPIHDGVPRLLVFSTGVAREFAQRHEARLRRELPEFDLPNGQAAPGEQDVLRTFSSEWIGYDWDGKAYWNLTPEAWFECMRFILDFERKPVTSKLVLEIGIGVGGVADHNSRAEGCELVGVDLGYAVDVAQRTFASTNPFLHVVQASAFMPPFRAETFDMVYSFGVLHHTYSTKAAFDRVCKLPKRGGRLYIWVYSPYDEQRNLLRRVLMATEKAVRPLAWRLPEKLQSLLLAPLVPAYMGYQALQVASGAKGRIPYSWREAMHAARDRFTPRFVHRHTDDEVKGWFSEAGFAELEASSERPRPTYVPIGFTACTGIAGTRGQLRRGAP